MTVDTATGTALPPQFFDEDAGEAYRDALAASELAAIVLRIELAAVEKAWAEEHTSLLGKLAAKDEQIWQLTQTVSEATVSQEAAIAHGAKYFTRPPKEPKPPRIGHREKPEQVREFKLREAGAMITTPAKRRGLQARPTYAVARPAWGEGHAGGKKALQGANAPGAKATLAVNQEYVAALKKMAAEMKQAAATTGVTGAPVAKTPVTKTPASHKPKLAQKAGANNGLKKTPKAGGVKRKAAAAKPPGVVVVSAAAGA